jgi:uncharacterized protein (UPF0303 family)
MITLKHFTTEDAYLLGTRMRAEALENKLPIVIDIRSGDTPMFAVMLPGAGLANFDWARRKRNLTLLTGEDTWTLSQKRANREDLIELMGLEPRDYASHGGCVPIHVEGVGLVATVTVSGLPQKEDHDFAIKHLSALASEQN